MQVYLLFLLIFDLLNSFMLTLLLLIQSASKNKNNIQKKGIIQQTSILKKFAHNKNAHTYHIICTTLILTNQSNLGKRYFNDQLENIRTIIDDKCLVKVNKNQFDVKNITILTGIKIL